MSSARQVGKCKWFDRKKGYGFIECQGQADVFVHQTEIQLEGFRALYPDQEVEFTIEHAGPKSRPCATRVSGVSGSKLEPRTQRRQFGARGRGGRGGRGGRSAEGAKPAPRDNNSAPATAPVTDSAAPAAAGDSAKAPRRRRKATKPRRPRAPLNSAFVFIKPHAVTDLTKDLLRQKFAEKGIRIYKEGSLSAEEIDSKKLIDQHYYAIASKATILQPSQLVVPEDKFQQTFKVSWKKVLEDGLAFNALDGCKHLGITAEQLDELWAQTKKNNKLAKLGGGFYCGLVEVKDKKPIYIFNGFFMAMRTKFTTPGTSIYYFAVEWPASKLSWKEFRGQFLGPTDPAEAPAESLRGILYARWKEFGLTAVPNTGDNGVHASASPFEALAERMNWLKTPLKRDRFGQALLAAGVDEDTINDWSRDPQVNVPEEGQKSLFDSLEDLDAVACLEKCKKIGGKAPAPAPAADPK
eukprot:c3535_g1_i1.p1 GENE.c3535_g1_i1~~c3535_g1_i1.p1  ORF type:complete len:486 (+),score=93.97 c3535_g1_i1:59-1459(+)